jgi:hypothetical protein
MILDGLCLSNTFLWAGPDGRLAVCFCSVSGLIQIDGSEADTTGSSGGSLVPVKKASKNRAEYLLN